MKSSLRFAWALACAIALGTGTAHAMGQSVKVFETSTLAGIWDHGTEFYLRFDLQELAGHTNPQFIWAGFHEVRTGAFEGEVVLNQFGPDEVRFTARAERLVASNASVFIVEILDGEGAVIKELLLKGPKVALLPTE
jgi:hypothetical protein